MAHGCVASPLRRFFNLDQDNNLDANDVQATLNRIALADTPTLGSELLKYCVAMRKNKEVGGHGWGGGEACRRGYGASMRKNKEVQRWGAAPAR